MPGKPRKNKQISIDYKTHHKLEKEAIENDTTIKDVAEKYLHQDCEKKINELEKRIERLKSKIEHLKSDRNKLEKEKRELKKQSSGKWEGYEEVSWEEFEELMKEHISGVGEKKASSFCDGLRDSVKIVAPKQDE